MAGRRDKCLTCKWFDRHDEGTPVPRDETRTDIHGVCRFRPVPEQGLTQPDLWCSNHEPEPVP